MSPLLIAMIVPAALALVAAVFVVGTYYKLLGLRNRFKNSLNRIDIQLKRRNELISGLVESAKGYLNHEDGTLQAIITARNMAVSANDVAVANPGNPAAMRRLAYAEGRLGGTLDRLFALSEAYPDLKASTRFSSLKEELDSTETKVSYFQNAYNDSVMAYNAQQESFPNSLIAGTFNFTAAEPCTIKKEPNKREPPKELDSVSDFKARPSAI